MGGIATFRERSPTNTGSGFSVGRYTTADGDTSQTSNWGPRMSSIPPACTPFHQEPFTLEKADQHDRFFHEEIPDGVFYGPRLFLVPRKEVGRRERWGILYAPHIHTRQRRLTRRRDLMYLR